MSEIGTVSHTLSREWANAQSEWTRASDEWRDEKRIAFERRYWTTLEREIPRLTEALQDLMAAIRESQQVISG